MDLMPAMVKEWTYMDHNNCMYTVAMRSSFWSPWVFENCPWWLDFPAGQYFTKEKDDFLQESQSMHAKTKEKTRQLRSTKDHTRKSSPLLASSPGSTNSSTPPIVTKRATPHKARRKTAPMHSSNNTDSDMRPRDLQQTIELACSQAKVTSGSNDIVVG
ncbi:hypothetical protein O6H91_02G023700 [Diphasiastrum complanatum]|uniref:Uncharacterized protein n=1 Tax=Diphasiastrum complanatum TaxID=34168 RepID=A0ACC2EDQ9_DIPCM|nr:hypothetical protein O6H91_02G023700 [Diphasiastrum complanatum]